MNNDIMLQNLTEAFEVLKDSWATKDNAIVNCIVETERYDGSLAMDMWQYVIQQNTDDINCFYSILKRFCSKNSRWATKEDYCKVFLEHIVKHINHPELITTIFGLVIGANDDNICAKDKATPFTINVTIGGSGGNIDSCASLLSAFLASILLVDNPLLAMNMINSMIKNDKVPNSSIGNLFASAQEYVAAVHNHKSEFSIGYEVTDSVKEAMFSSIETIKDKETRAECTIAILSM